MGRAVVFLGIYVTRNCRFTSLLPTHPSPASQEIQGKLHASDVGLGPLAFFTGKNGWTQPSGSVASSLSTSFSWLLLRCPHDLPGLPLGPACPVLMCVTPLGLGGWPSVAI